jgi:tetratricopeptide (TPR) repeat protein
MRVEWEQVVQEGIQHLQRAVELDPRYDEAMTYLNLLIRSRADFADNPYAYQAEMVKAETWVKKALEIKKQKGPAEAPALTLAAPPLPTIP